jgi:pSer/pThr/pTyr-binding forkhead associated (FHA) protein
VTGAPGALPSSGTCPACRGAVVPRLPFCPSCGQRLVVAGLGPSCVHCGTPLVQRAKFCAACGRPVTAVQVGSSQITLSLLDEAGTVLQQFPVTGEDITVGRDDASIAFPDDAFMSPLHAQLTVGTGTITVRDLGSRNGTWCFLTEPHRLIDGDLLLIGSQVIRFRRLGYPGPHPPERDATRRMGSLIPSADIACLTQLRADGSVRDVIHLSPGRHICIGRDRGDWMFPYDPSMSGMHAQIRSEDADFVLMDAGSRNGVGLSVRGEVTLANGSRFLVGDKMLRVDIA